MMAAQLHEKLHDADTTLSQSIERGNLRPVGTWLKESIHSKGRSVGALGLLEDLTGSALDEKALLRHLENFYL